MAKARKATKRRKRAGRKNYNVYVYFWYDNVKKKRVSWFFPSKPPAERWRNNAYWRYHKHPVMDLFLNTVPKTMWPREKVWWMRHRDNYLNTTLERARVVYMGDKFKLTDEEKYVE